ncbi:MAG: FAD-binding oxidoreductase [Proteobacteria bacterium]|nr:FAD-binding oxidoreductase [Pseudomonadota bacterium]NBX86262.1 FAD-binding oxidoreductase [Pseudomonadota bacterium]
MNIAVIGAGISGLLTTRALQRAGKQVTLFSSGNPSASSLALGMLTPSSLQRPVDALQRHGIQQWDVISRELASTHGVAPESFYRQWGNSRQLNVPVVLELLYKDVRHQGTQVTTQTIHALDDVSADFEAIIVAAGAGTAALLAPLPNHQMMGEWRLSRGQVIRLQPPSPLAAPVVADNLFVVPDWNSSVMIGSKNSTLSLADSANPPPPTPRPEHTAELWQRGSALVPMLAEAKLLEAWVGYRPISNPRLPLLRQVAPKVWAVAGIGKVGFALAPCVAQAAVEQLT